MKSWCLAGMMIVAGLMAGCTDDYWPIIDPKPTTGTLKTETSSPKTVDVTVAKAWYWNNEITILGSVVPSALAGKEDIGGFVDVEILDQNNNVIETAMASLMPSMLSADHPAQYKISIWAQHPCDDHLKLVFVDQRDESAYLGQTSGGGAGAAGQSGNYSRPSGGGGGNGFGDFGHGVTGVGGVGGVSGVGGYSGSAVR